MATFSNFIVLCFTFRSMIHFELIFLKDVRSGPRFIFGIWISSWCSTVCWGKIQPFVHWIAFVLWSKIDWLYLCGSISGTHSVPGTSLSVLSLIIPCLDCCNFKSLSQVMAVFWLLQYCGGCCLLSLHMNLRIGLSMSTKRSPFLWDFHWDCVKSIDGIGKNWHHYNVESFYQWMWTVSPFISIFNSCQNFSFLHIYLEYTSSDLYLAFHFC